MLSRFADKRSITFPLLSDPGSKTIEAYGILNPEAKGMPYPGTFLIDREGVVRAKLFLDDYRERHNLDVIPVHGMPRSRGTPAFAIFSLSLKFAGLAGR